MRPSLAVALIFASIAIVARAETAKPVATASVALPAADPSDEVAPYAIEITRLAVHSDGQFVILDVNLKSKPANTAGVVLKGYFDTDNSEATGSADRSKNRHGFEYVSEVKLCIQDFKGGATCSGGEDKPNGYYSIAEVARYKKGAAAGEIENVRLFYDAPQSPISGSTVEGKIAYADLGMKPGQIVRLSACSMASAFRDRTFFPDIVLKLK